MPDLLLELGLEEVPARMIPAAQAELLRRTLALLGKEALLPQNFDPLADALSYSTPRRLAVLIRGVETQQKDITEEVTGPAVKIAFKDGIPTPAAEAFARKSGVAVSDLKTISTPKGEYLAATSTKKGRPAAEVLAAELPKEIAAIYWAKNMRWIPGSNEKFVRPVLWIACLLGDETVPITFGGKTAGRLTYGHRILHGDVPIEIESPNTYLTQLAQAHVCADVELRRHRIRKALDHTTRKVPNARWREDEPLVDAVTHLTEWPDVLLGNFEPDYLKLPEEVLVTVMRDHQKYFAIEDANGKLAPHFLAVLNIETDTTNEPIIRQGNERVLRARFNDARFFWEFDQRTPLTDRVALLEKVTFQKDLGSYAEKTDRVRILAGFLSANVMSRNAEVDIEALGTAVRLAKVDLTTELVKEFTELQGIIGGLYAIDEKVSEKASYAIYDQYLPAGMSDGIPRTIEGAILGIADRADTIAGMFGLGMEPTGSKDPFGLRRAGNGIIKILAESGIPLTLTPIVNHATYGEELAPSIQLQEVAAKMLNFLYERLEFYLREARGQAYDVVTAVLSPMRNLPNYGDVADAVARAEAVTSVRDGEDFLAVSAAFKRMKNILDQANAKNEPITPTIDHELLLDPSEKFLAVTASAAASAVEVLQSERKYTEALSLIATLRPAIDAFFEKVMVMAPEPDIRANRLALLHRTLADFSRIADFSEIVTAG